MKFFLCRIFPIFSIAFVFNGCKNDLKVNAPYKEIPSIYAVLNPQETTQMIRINKVFLGEADANQMAQVADSINYPAGEITVTLDHTDDAGKTDIATPTGNKLTINFTDTVIEAKEGAFNKSQRVYTTTDKLLTTGIYYLTVKNNRTGNIFTAKAPALDSVKGSITFPLIAPYYPYSPTASPDSYIDYWSKNGSVRFAPNKASFYQLNIRVHFYDSVVGVRYNKYVDYGFGVKNVKETTKQAGQDFILYSFTNTDFFNAMKVGLSKMNLNNNIPGRRTYKIEYIIYSTTQEFMDYNQYVAPSLSISQSKPLYSNFDNQAALGLFTVRARCSVSKAMAAGFIDQFAYNPSTCAYQFVTFAGTKPGCNY